MTKRMFGFIALMMLMMATSLSAHADVTLKGSFDNWGEGIVMTQDDDGCWTVTKAFAEGEQIKFYDNGWIGAPADGNTFWVTSEILNKGTLVELHLGDAYKNLEIKVAGTYKIVLDASGNQYKMRMGVEAPVSVNASIVNGTVTANKTKAIPGETVRITVKPNAGYYIERSNITVEKTIGGGQAQAPGIKAEGPTVGSFVDVEGDPINSVDEENVYTFAMPESPYGAKISAEFQQCTAITSVDAIADQTYTGEAITPAVVVKAGDTTLGESDYTVEYSNNTAVGQATVTVTGKGKYTGTITANFNIVKAPHNVTVAQLENGAIEASPTSAVEGTIINLTITPATGYAIGEVYYMNGTEKVVIEGTSFVMPDFDVEINATFTAIDYTITVTQGENGTISADKTTAHVGDVVTLTNTPNPDCVFVSYTVTDAQGNPVTVENNQFTMPASNVTVTATFRALEVAYKIKWGEGDNWSTVNKIDMTKGADGKWATADGTDMTAANQFKVVKDVTNGDNVVETWYGASATVTEPTQVITVGDDGPNIHIGRPGTFSFSFDPETMKLTVTSEFIYNVTVNEAQNGTVTANPTQAKAGDAVALTIKPAPGYEVDQITVKNGEENVAVENNKFTMPAGDVTVTVTFKAIDYTITVTQGENGTIAADKTTAHVGDVVTLTNTPNVDCVFVSYTVTDAEGNPVTVENNKFTMPASNVTVTATFRALEVTYSIKWGEGDSWSTVNEIGMTKGADGKWISTQATEMTATSQFKVYKSVRDGETLSSETWLGKEYQVTELPATIEGLAEYTPNITLSKAGTYSFSYDPVTNILVVTGEIEPEKYTITVAEGIEHGTVVPDKTEAAAGETVTLTVTPAEGYELETLTVMNGETAVEVTNNTFVMPAGDVTITATFKESIVNYNLTWSVTPAEGGTVEIKAGETVLTTSPAQVAAGTHITITPSPAQGYEVESVKVNGTPLLTIDDDETGGEFGAPALKDFPGGISAGFGTYGFDMAEDAEVVVTFKKTEYTITVTEPQNGTVVPSATTANMGDEITLTITPATGYEIDEVTVMAGEDEVELDSDYKFTMPASDVTVTVTFKAITYELEGVAFTSERKWATYYNERDLALPQGMKAYVVDAINGDATEITEIPYIPAGVGVLLYSETAGENFTTVAYTGETGTYTSKLVGSNEAQEIAAGAGYVLYNNYFILSEGGTVAAHRCYLPVQTTMGAPRTLKIGQNGTVSAIETLIAEGNVAAVKYVNLSGMTSDQPFNGVNIAVVTFTDGTTRTIKLVK
ncbi:MAG: hypothetical protein IJM66_06670 [Muribaculaceae bacterium]|nr:hypothetical protein [Muribaculaceae bacterium]